MIHIPSYCKYMKNLYVNKIINRGDFYGKIMIVKSLRLILNYKLDNFISFNLIIKYF